LAKGQKTRGRSPSGGGGGGGGGDDDDDDNHNNNNNNILVYGLLDVLLHPPVSSTVSRRYATMMYAHKNKIQ
jgi:hypothetical protein